MKGIAKLTLAEHEAILLLRDNLWGGDPYMGHVRTATVARLVERGFARRTVGEDREGYMRQCVPTDAGLAWIGAMTHGPTLPPDMTARTYEPTLESGYAYVAKGDLATIPNDLIQLDPASG